MVTPILLVSICLVALFITGLLVSACVLAGRLDSLHQESIEKNQTINLGEHS